jgi:dihydrofolate synthase/folylpolyglutamate synthase
MSGRSLAAWLQRLESLHPSAIDLGLERVSEVATRLNCLIMACPVVTVAGTNGKGSAVAALQAFACAAGLRVGAYTSPHLSRYNERICIDAEPVGDSRITAAFESIDVARQQVSLTYFEFSTLAALHIFAAEDLDLVILEVGLGGRLDAVNILDPDLAIITSISLDHQAWLGDTREIIALEKAGILRPGIPVMVADPEPAASLRARIEELACKPCYVDAQLLEAIGSCPLRAENIGAAWQAANALDFAPAMADLPALVQRLSLPGRMQTCLVAGVSVVVDVAHNEAAVANLSRELKLRDQKPRLALLGALSDKDIHAMIRSCHGLFDGWYVTDLPGVERALPATQLATVLLSQGEQVRDECSSPERAFESALEELNPGATLVVFGSFHTVAALLPALALMGDSP